MTLRVIGAGLGRTGTMSLKFALQSLLGGRCYHMAEVVRHPRHSEFWSRRARGEDVDYSEVFGDFVAAVDWPSARYYAELAERYPEAKVVLSVRDPQRWYDSVADTIYPLTQTLKVRPGRWVKELHAGIRDMNRMVDDVIWGPRGQLQGRFEDRDQTIAVFEAHNEEVKRTIPADRLLVYEIKQGWEPLCEFLGVPVPDEPMPHVNDRAEMLRRIRIIRAAGWLTAPVTLPLRAVRRVLGG